MNMNKLAVTSKEEVNKALSGSLGNAFEMEDITEGLTNQEVTPTLLTTLFLGDVTETRLSTNIVKMDETFQTLQLPNGKSFQDYGSDLQKDKPRQLIYEVGSKGVRLNVAPRDYMNKRIPHSNERQDEAYVVSLNLEKMAKAWSLERELSLAQIITLDTNRTAGGPAPVYNFYDDIVGSSRPAKIDIDLGGTLDVWQLMTDQQDKLIEDVEKTGNSFNGTIVLAGRNWFNARLDIEKQADLARAFVNVSGILDLQTSAVKTMTDSNAKFRYQNFESAIDGILYVRYDASILGGGAMIGANDAYMLPLGAENMFREIFAPAETRSYVNTEALTMYTFSNENERSGVNIAQESNSLIANVAPTLIRALTFTP